MTTLKHKDMVETLQEWEDVKREVMHYLAMGVDCFTVSLGSFTITYDETKEREANK